MKFRKILFLFFLFILPFSVSAKTTSTIIMDNTTGRILYQENIHEQKLIASITKVMTAIVVLENFDIKKTITVGEEVLSMYGTNIYLEVGEEMTIEDLLYGLLLRSGNDAATTLATNTVGEKEFVDLMNEKAQSIGMKETTFENPHGLDDDTKNLSTAFDMALLARYAYQNPIYQKMISTKKYITKSNLKSYEWYNRMSLLTNYKYCIGGKNGYTPKAGKTLISYAKKNNQILIIVSLNDSNLYKNHKYLYEKYFSMIQNYTIIEKTTFNKNPLFKTQNLYIKEDFQYPLLESEIKDISTIVEIDLNSKDKIKGKVRVLLNQEEIGSIQIYSKAKKKKDKKNIFQIIIHWITGKN